MATRAEKERQKAQQEKFQAVLSNLLKDDDNKYCVDCDAKGPRWASWNLGVFLCIRCAGIHRNLGVHISKVKSVNLDTWTPEQIAMMMEVGNSRARAAYEANLPDNYRRPQTDSALEAFIRSKYETKKYIAREWVPPKPAVPKELLEDDKDKKKSKGKGSAVSLSAVPRSHSGASLESQGFKAPENKAQNTVKVSTPQQPKAPPPVVATSNTADLIGLDAPSAPVSQPNNLLGDLDEFMSAPLTTPTSQPVPQPANNLVSNGGLSDDLFAGMTGSTEETKPESKSTKDSILALYGGQKSQQPQQQYGVPGGVYMQQQPQTMGNMYNMQQQMPMQQPMYNNQMGMMGMGQGQGQVIPGMGMGMHQQPQQQQQQQQQRPMMMNQGNVAMYGQQQPQMQFQQMQHQMAGMSIGQPAQMGMTPGGQGWGTQPSGHTLSTNLWQ